MSLLLQWFTSFPTDISILNADHTHQMVHAWNIKQYGTGSLPWTHLESNVDSLSLGSSATTHPILLCGHLVATWTLWQWRMGAEILSLTEVLTGNKSSIQREGLWLCVCVWQRERERESPSVRATTNWEAVSPALSTCFCPPWTSAWGQTAT